MNKILFICIIICSGLLNAQEQTIPYLLDWETENSIYQYLELKKANKDSVVFIFENLDREKVKIHISKKSQNFQKSNRKLFINDRLYPIIFEMDYWFYTETKNDFPIISKETSNYKSEFVPIPNLKERKQNAEKYAYRKLINIIDWSIYWIVDRKGKLVETNTKI
ncbi:hypothetical protein [Flavobacterium aestuarii]|uniref:hypothetical protein n=1 Tax=Flavobacterium aestuarii TaxID=3149227 RepID=UPI0032B3717C